MIARIQRPANQAAYAFEMTDFGPGELLVTGFDGTEGLSRLYEFRIQLCSQRNDIDPEQVIGRAARCG
jgi:type VI secretion system secreted protein VgrG